MSDSDSIADLLYMPGVDEIDFDHPKANIILKDDIYEEFLEMLEKEPSPALQELLESKPPWEE
ncbi:hypothetical protein H0A36_22895 [Endozoicomonas sp. SM1973]|uniref:Uncharacterized protein n=1 Tax=Spartinivicinus marinus TaxID=2994442 RepID=A0A853IFW7_9GAMM|nr:hypothetical protein [Spartinivicinus marinus]MCX4027495.1 hypothetical protein [Spartinivicinus marinus]NYZ68871.1 hypothetical protein [Spartinivicinus marinus]